MSSDSRPITGSPAAVEVAGAGDPRQLLGRSGEDHAARHLERLGVRILARNVRTRFGEIDLIAFDGSALVFAEVKTRRARGRPIGSRGLPSIDLNPLDSLRPRQRARLRRLAHAWLSSPDIKRPRAREIRFDAIGVVLDRHGRLRSLEHLEAAW